LNLRPSGVAQVACDRRVQVKCSLCVQLSVLFTHHDPGPSRARFRLLHPRISLNTALYLHIFPQPMLLQHPPALPHQPNPAPLSFRSPIALPPYHPNTTHESTAPRRGFMSSGAVQLPSHRGGRCRHRGAVMGCPGAADPATRARFAPSSRRSPSSWPSRMSGRRPRRSSLCPRPLSAVWPDVQLVGRTSGVRTSGVHATGGVSRRTRVRCPRPLHPSCPHRAGSWNAAGQPTFGRSGFDVSPWGPRAAWSSLPESGLAGKGWSCVGSACSHEGRRQTWAAAWYAHRLRRHARRLADQGSWSSARCRSVGWGSTGKEQVLTRRPAGASWAGCRRDARPWGWTGGW
jgi:hypothetical protein